MLLLLPYHRPPSQSSIDLTAVADQTTAMTYSAGDQELFQLEKFLDLHLVERHGHSGWPPQQHLSADVQMIEQLLAAVADGSQDAEHGQQETNNKNRPVSFDITTRTEELKQSTFTIYSRCRFVYFYSKAQTSLNTQ